METHFRKFLSVALCAALIGSSAAALPLAVPDSAFSGMTVHAEDVTQSTAVGISYDFTGRYASKAGYAEGTITLKAQSGGSYKLYWADDSKALGGYYPLGEFSLSSGGKGTVNMGYHTAIPANATKIIATTGSLNVPDAAYVYDIPATKQLSHAVSGDLLYTFSTYSDIHLDARTGSNLFWTNAKTNLAKALSISADKGADYVVVSGDCVTCSDPASEWNSYEKILSQSDYFNPIWETNGNPEVKDNDGVTEGLSKFKKATGTDGSNSGKSYFSMTEEKTGDLFIFMSLEKKDPNKEEVISGTQITWARNLISENYSSKNIFIVEHAPVKGFGAGDRMSKPYYGGLLNTDYANNRAFKQILIDYPDIVFLSGHTHEDFSMDYNYSDEYSDSTGKAANMIHTPALAGSKLPKSNDTELEANGGKGFNCQAYITEVYENEIIFYGADVSKELIYPQYSYIMEGSRTSASAVNQPQPERPLKNVTVSITEELDKVSQVLSDKYQYASYDAYQAVKKLYYKYRDKTQADESVIDEFEERLSALASVAGGTIIHNYYDKYYFVNTNSWSTVWAYAWDSSGKNGAWPGVQISKCGTYENKDVYKVAFNSKGEYKNLIFNNGSSDKQTVDIDLSAYDYNAFSISGKSGTKYTVKNFSYSADTPAEPLDNRSTISAGSIQLGGSVTISGIAQGGKAPYTYQYNYKGINDLEWILLSDYSTKTSETFKASEAGTFSLKVNVKDSAGTVASKEFSVTFTDPAIAATGIELSRSTANMLVGRSCTATAAVTPDDATDKTVTWTSSDTSVATVENGKITAVGAGTATVTAKTSNGITAEVAVKVSVAAESISLSRTTANLLVGHSCTATATVLPENAGNKTVTWTSSNKSVATVSNGKITGVAAGKATITAKTTNGITAKIAVTVKDSGTAPTGITLSKSTTNLVVGHSTTVTAAVTPSTASNKTVSWTSSDTSIATVSNGRITAVGGGTATVTAKTSNGLTATVTVKVTVPVISISLSRERANLLVGHSCTATAYIYPSDATNKTVRWTSSDTSVATVSKGKITAVGVGTATITATTSNGKTATVAVTVKG